jgi:hypothetical protein
LPGRTGSHIQSAPARDELQSLHGKGRRSTLQGIKAGRTAEGADD